MLEAIEIWFATYRVQLGITLLVIVFALLLDRLFTLRTSHRPDRV